MDLETKIWLGLIVMFAAGMVAGWFFTYIHYMNEKAVREAVEEERKNRIYCPMSKTYEQEQRDALKELQRFCDSYIVTDEDKTWTYTIKEK